MTMEFLKILEATIMDTSEKLPKLPDGLAKLFGDFVWIYAIIVAVLNGFSLLAFLTAGLFVGMGLGLFGIFWLIISLLALTGVLVSLYLNVKAIEPLREKQYKGWQILLLSIIFSLIFGILLSRKMRDLIPNLFWSALGLYILTQIRSQFVLGSELTMNDLKFSSKK